MNRKVSAPIVVVACLVLAGFIYLIAKWSFHVTPANENPGLSDIPPRIPGHDKPVPPPKDAGPVPGTMPR